MYGMQRLVQTSWEVARRYCTAIIVNINILLATNHYIYRDSENVFIVHVP